MPRPACSRRLRSALRSRLAVPGALRRAPTLLASVVAPLLLGLGAPACDVVTPDGPTWRVADLAGFCSIDADCGPGGSCVAQSCFRCGAGCQNGGYCVAPDRCQCPEGRLGTGCDLPVVRVRAGSFTMGSQNSEDGRDADEAQHQVTLTRDFWLGATEVTQAQWRAMLGSNPSRFDDCDACPVESVSWDDAVAYLNALSDREGLGRCYDGANFRGVGCEGYRLPTEAEWEYAARAGTTGPRYGDLDAIAWHFDNSGGETHPVGQKQPNAWGLHDMLGNVSEWLHDWYGSYPSGAVSDPQGPVGGANRVSRGGGWGSGAGSLRAAARGSGTPGVRDYGFLGFRLSRSVP
jgi:formylglycine-generating enzyme required for sulfatase activity